MEARILDIDIKDSQLKCVYLIETRFLEVSSIQTRLVGGKEGFGVTGLHRNSL